MSGIIPIDGFGGGGSGGGVVYPNSAARPFNSNSARNTWANNNKSDLIKDTTVVNVNGSQWYLWTGESNPSSVNSNLWMDADQIVQGEPGSDGVSISSVSVNANDELIINKDDGSSTNLGRVTGLSAYEVWELQGNTGTEQDYINSLKGVSAYQVWLDQGNTGTEQDYIDSLKGDKGDNGDITATASTNELLKVDSTGAVVGTGVFSDKDGSATFGSGSIDIGMHNISSAGEGVEATNQGTNESYSFVFSGQGNDTGPVHRLIDDNKVDIETVATKTKQLTNHVSRLNAPYAFRLLRLPITIDAVSAQTNVTMQIRELNGEDVWSYGPFDIASGINTFTPSTILDFRADQYNVEFSSPDGDVVLFGDVSAATGLDIVYAILPTKSWVDETLANIKQDGEIVRAIEAGNNVTLTTDADGNLTISSTGGAAGSTLDVDGNETEVISTSTGITSDYDAATKTTTLTVDPTNIDLSGYAELDADVSFSKVTVQNATDPLYNSVVNVTNGGNSEVNLVGTTNIRKVDKATGDTTDVISINGTNGSVDLKTDVTYQGAITNDKAPVTKEYLEAFGRGIGVPAYVTVEGGNNYVQTTPVASFENSGTNINDVTIEIDGELLESETIITMPTDGYVTTKRFEVYQTVQNQGTSKDIKSGDTWRVRHVGQEWFWEKVYAGGGNIVYGLGGRNDIVTDRSVKLFAYREGMPEHLLIETPSGSRLVHEFPRNKTFRFTPINSDRQHDGNVLLSQGNQGVATNDLELGQYSDIPLYIIEPNVVVNRDQRAWVNFPASVGIDVSAGFYAFGTVSGWCGNSTTEGGVAVYVGTSENFRSYTQNIGFVLGNTGLYLLDGQNLRTPDNNAAMAFNIEPGVTHMYRYAFYVDATGMMNYYIVDLNTGQVSQGTQQCNLASIGSDPKLYVSYDRYSNSTAAIAIAETHLVVNSTGVAEDRWNWRN
ncbi:hypothetical protein NVP1038O_13 [Vibrio phage 1.038.O._10N.286.51.C2]|nr:hypothetical protein NVP1038O_13 [Vibrio phage 1.038.O._10N.286.51.C2]